MTTYIASDVFSSLHPMLPQLTPVVLCYPSDARSFVFIGGKISHWVKRVVNGFENSRLSAHTRNMLLNGIPLTLKMIRKAWEAVELGEIAMLRQTKLTIDHFVKKTHSRMREFLSAQILLPSVHELLW